MRKVLTYTALATLLMLGSTSCVRSIFEQDSQAAQGITLDISCLDRTVTKADATKPGEDLYNENKINTVYYFFYPEGGEGANAVLYGSFDAGGADYANKSISTTDAFVTGTLFPTGTTKCSVLLIANYSGTIDYSKSSVAELLALKVTNDFVTNPTQASLVMVSRGADGKAGTVEVPLISRNKTTVATASVSLQRVCSKVTLALHVADTATFTRTVIVGETSETRTETWRPSLSGTSSPIIYMGNSNAKGVVGGDPDTVSEPFNYDNSTRHLSGETENHDYYTYTYNSGTGNYDKTTTTAAFSLCEPFYSYPQTWEFGSGTAPYLKLVIQWTRDAGEGYGTLQRPYYYKINSPGTALTGNKMTLASNYWYKVFINVAILGSETDDAVVNLSGTYYINDWQEGAGSGGSGGSGYDTDKPTAITAARYLSVPRTEYVLNNVDNLSIPFITSDPCEITGMSISYTNYSQADASHAPASSYIVNQVISTNWTNSTSGWDIHIDGTNIKFAHTIDNDTSGNTYDVAPYSITFRIKHADSETYYRDITIIQKPAIMITSQKNTSGSYTYVNGGNGNNYGGNPSGTLSGGNSNPYMFIIETTVLPSNSAYMLGDPRKALDNLGQTWSKNSPAIIGTNRQITYYHPALDNSTGENIIAPKFRIASSYGVCSPLSYANAQKRCASYQEFGYPAGRWRLPTAAEILYMATLNTDGKIVRLLGGNNEYGYTPYWCGDGYVNVPNGYNTSGSPEVVASTTNSDATYVRCVYDEWYWSNVDIDSSTAGIQNTVAPNTFTWGDME